MKLSDFMAVAFKHLRARLLETIIIIVAIGLGTGVISMALGLGFAARDIMNESQQQSYFRTINIRTGEEHMGIDEEVFPVGDKIPEEAKFTLNTILEIKENCEAVDYVFTSMGTSLQIEEFNEPPPSMDDREAWQEWEDKRRQTTIQVEMTFPDQLEFYELSLAQGNLFNIEDIFAANRVIVLGAGAAAEHFAGKNPVGQILEVKGQEPYTVIGVLEDIEYKEISNGDFRSFSREERYHYGGFIPYTAQGNFGVSVGRMVSEKGKIVESTEKLNDFKKKEFNINNITAAVVDVEQVEEAESQITSFLKNQFVDGYNVTSAISARKQNQQQNLRAMMITAFIASLGLLIAAINILNLMLARVLRRTKDMGVLKALGSTGKNIFKLFLLEALLLGFFGALLGFALASGGEILIGYLAEGFQITIDWRVFLSAVGIAGFVSAIFGIYPALQAAGIDPVTALRTE